MEEAVDLVFVGPSHQTHVTLSIRGSHPHGPKPPNLPVTPSVFLPNPTALLTFPWKQGSQDNFRSSHTLSRAREGESEQHLAGCSKPGRHSEHRAGGNLKTMGHQEKMDREKNLKL